MTYVDGFVLAVPADHKEAYREHAAAAQPLFKEFGATRMVECWGDDIPDGKVTDFKGAVQAQPDEIVVFSWLEYPSRAVRDGAIAKMMSDPRMESLGAAMPFDGKRMIFGGFEAMVDEGAADGSRYVDGLLIPVPPANRDAYRAMAARAAPIFREYGASRVVETWGDDIHDGKVTDFRRAVRAEGDENVVFSWIEWPSKEVRNEGWRQIMADGRMKPEDSKGIFDGGRMIWAGFAPILDL